MMNCSWEWQEEGERGGEVRGDWAAFSKYLPCVLSLYEAQTAHIIKKSVKWPCEESKLCHSTGEQN